MDIWLLIGLALIAPSICFILYHVARMVILIMESQGKGDK